MKPRTIFQSTKQVISSTADIAVATFETTSDMVRISGSIVSHNLHAMKVATIRDNSVENLEDAKQAFSTVTVSMQETRNSIAEADEFTASMLQMFLDAETNLLKDIATSAKL